MKPVARGFIILLACIAIVAMTGWGALAIYYSNLPREDARRILAVAFAIFGAAALNTRRVPLTNISLLI